MNNSFRHGVGRYLRAQPHTRGAAITCSWPWRCAAGTNVSRSQYQTFRSAIIDPTTKPRIASYPKAPA
eukprot:252960-Rhodomonas_salina.2